MVSSQGRRRVDRRGDQGADEQADAVGQDGEAGVQRVGAVALLLIDGEQHVEGGGEEEQRADNHAAAEAGDPQQAEVEQRTAGMGCQPGLEP